MIELVDWRREHAEAFRRLNLDWIQQLFVVEPADLEVLDDPQSAIVDAGGMIFFALEDGAAIGTVAMLKAAEGRYELAKMAVASSHRRRGIAERLGAACIDWARRQGARSVFLVTNSSLAGAIRLYERLGFRHGKDPNPSHYARADVYMELPIGTAGG